MTEELVFYFQWNVQRTDQQQQQQKKSRMGGLLVSGYVAMHDERCQMKHHAKRI
jgi:cytochrome c-type biogenesis protein CcmE